MQTKKRNIGKKPTTSTISMFLPMKLCFRHIDGTSTAKRQHRRRNAVAHIDDIDGDSLGETSMPSISTIFSPTCTFEQIQQPTKGTKQ
jgi:hypothetical protein